MFLSERWTNKSSAPVSDVHCGDPGTPVNGERFGNEFTYGKIVRFDCMPGYKLVGDIVSGCKIDGTWSAALPTCQSNYIFSEYYSLLL